MKSGQEFYRQAPLILLEGSFGRRERIGLIPRCSASKPGHRSLPWGLLPIFKYLNVKIKNTG
jgi:hypothetical protein